MACSDASTLAARREAAGEAFALAELSLGQLLATSRDASNVLPPGEHPVLIAYAELCGAHHAMAATLRTGAPSTRSGVA